MSTQQENREDNMNGGEGTMITALCWVSRGFARPVLLEADPEQDYKNIMAHSRMQKKLAA